MNKVSKKATIYPGVKFGKNVFVDDYSIIGYPVRGSKKNGKTIIGDGAVIRSHTVIYSGNVIGKNFQTGHNVLVREENDIGDDVSIGSGSCVEHHVKICDGVRIHTGAFIPEHTTLKEKVWIGPNVVITNVLHPLCLKAKECARGAYIEKGAKIGANTTLCPDVKIGSNSLVGAGSVVIKDVPDNVVAAGNPARVLKSIGSIKCRYNLTKKPY